MAGSIAAQVNPLIDVRACLADYRASGVEFEEAWAAALSGVPPGWRCALEATAESWRRGYERDGAWLLDAVQQLRAAAAEDDAAARPRARVRLVA